MARLSFKTRPQDTDWGSLVEIWDTAEELPDLDAGWLFDHFMPILTDRTDGPCFEGWTALSYLAGRTERLRLGLMVTGNTYRHPAVLANMAATLDVASGGRLELGLGAGWFEEEHRVYGLPFPPVQDRLRALDEACEVIDSLLTQTTTTFDGNYYRLQDAYCEPKPVQAPRPPLVIGGGGERFTLRTAARWADQWNFPGRDPDELRQKHDVLRRHCADIGRDPEEIEVSVHLFDEGGDGSVVDSARGLVAAGADHLILYLEAPFDAARLVALTELCRDALA
jgi:F420-dependent oxidoreductase-like protein